MVSKQKLERAFYFREESVVEHGVPNVKQVKERPLTFEELQELDRAQGNTGRKRKARVLMPYTSTRHAMYLDQASAAVQASEMHSGSDASHEGPDHCLQQAAAARNVHRPQKPAQRKLLQHALTALVNYLAAPDTLPADLLGAAMITLDSLKGTGVPAMKVEDVGSQSTHCQHCGVRSCILGYRVSLCVRHCMSC